MEIMPNKKVSLVSIAIKKRLENFWVEGFPFSPDYNTFGKTGNFQSEKNPPPAR